VASPYNANLMTVIGLHHAGVHVASLERSIAFYTAVFGFHLAERLSFGPEQLAFVAAGSARIELIADGAAGRETGVVDHVAFQVDDLDQWLQRLRARGVRLLDDAPVEVPALGARILFCLGPDGERIELFEQRASRPAMP
jgi:lactoylglutathione lyase